MMPAQQVQCSEHSVAHCFWAHYAVVAVVVVLSVYFSGSLQKGPSGLPNSSWCGLL